MMEIGWFIRICEEEKEDLRKNFIWEKKGLNGCEEK